MKKGISLIVLVITIIVIIILAGAVVLTLSDTNIIENANDAVTANDADVLAARELLFQAEVIIEKEADYNSTYVLYDAGEDTYWYNNDGAAGAYDDSEGEDMVEKSGATTTNITAP